MHETKFRVPVQLKLEGPAGSFVATFATLDVKDKDGDVTVKGAFHEGQPVRVSAWGHNWGTLPVGKGVIHSDETRAWIDGEFFLDTAGGKDTYATVKALGDLQERSYGYEVIESSKGEKDGERVRFLEDLNVFEVSPVMLGAGIGTATDEIKSGVKLGARNAAADQKMFQAIHDSTGELGADCGGKSRKGRKQWAELVIEGSYEDLAEDIDEAAEELFGEGPGRMLEVVGTFADRAIVAVVDYNSGDDEPTYYEIPYTADAMGEITLGTAVEVEIEGIVVPKSRAARASRKPKSEDRESGKDERGPDLTTWRDLASLLAT